MSRDITCVTCGRPVDNSETIQMPHGLVCLDPCYSWLEQMMDEINEDEDEEIIFIYGLEDDDDDDYTEQEDYRRL